MPAAGIFGIVIGLGKNCIIMIAGIGWIDGDEGDGAQILARIAIPFKADRPGRFGFGKGGIAESGGQPY
ncbi:hypothetical protein JCM17846_29250 [Iodidimonas nitroreducens]|uniref:Uncharacterized protein n=1 Tax=Iodidimonas nitroreducens TaxID=1236968 RepID=A0A5A7NA40_9PROT|nr:hypothetical protein JCM17846_29250 [Iodidimonas nitroreducens]